MGKLCFSNALNDFIESWKSKPGNLIMILHKVQEEFGYISPLAAKEIANRTGVPLARIYGVITFYNFFKTEKPGKHKISVCLGTACYLKGGEDLYNEARRILDLQGKQCTTRDGEFTVEAVRCIGCCGLAPVISIDGEVKGRLKREDMKKIIEECRKKG